MNSLDFLMNNAPMIEKKIGYFFQDRSLLALAFIHRSYVNEHREITRHNERLEFLGDSVLGLVVANFLYLHFPEKPEGELSNLRSRIVDSHTCMTFVRKLDVQQYLLLGKGEKLNDGRGRESILGDLFEAIMGAIFLDAGMEAAEHFFLQHFTADLQKITSAPLHNWKALFQDYCQKTHRQPPIYKVLNECGPDHDKIFTIAVWINEEEMGRGEGNSKKDAQQSAAENALNNLKNKAHKQWQ